MIWFIADEHLGHKNMLTGWDDENKARPFIDLGHQTNEFVYRNNKVVRPEDTVFHIGDMFWRTFGESLAIDYTRRLYGTHIYVRGNHEELIDQSEALRNCFAAIHERIQIYPDGAPKHGIVLDHYAGRVWHDSDKGSWQLYGHTHNQLPEIDPLLAMDVGVDANNFAPVSLEQVANRMNAKTARILRGLGVKKG